MLRTYDIMIRLQLFYEVGSRFLLIVFIKINFYLKAKQEKHNIWRKVNNRAQYLVRQCSSKIL